MQNVGKLVKSLNQLQNKAKAIQQEIAEKTFEGTAANGLVKVTMTGKGNITRVDIDETVMSEGHETVADLVTVAAGKAYEAKEEYAGKKVKELGSGLLPFGLTLPGML